MTTYNITGTVTNKSGLFGNITGTLTTTTATALAPVINSVVVTPSSAPTGTLRTITINATDPQGQALTYTCLVNNTAAVSTISNPNVFSIIV